MNLPVSKSISESCNKAQTIELFAFTWHELEKLLLLSNSRVMRWPELLDTARKQSAKVFINESDIVNGR